MKGMAGKFIAAAALVCAAPVVAQQETATHESAMSPEALDGFAGMMAGLFQTEPLTDEQTARLPAAQAVVGQMTGRRLMEGKARGARTPGAIIGSV